MSELLAAAAAALGTPEALVSRSAEARAAETGASVEEILTAWAGGAPAPTATAKAEEAPASQAEADAPEVPSAPAEVAAPVVVEAVPSARGPEHPATLTASGKPPVLKGASDNPLAVVFGALGLFLAVFLVGLVGPAQGADAPGARSSEIALSEAAESGRSIYASLGCGSCHTQLVRPIVSDVGLGAVSLSDSNQLLGSRRFGPDLSDVGSRMDADAIEEVVEGAGGHGSMSLSDEDLTDLVAYLVESSTGASG